MHRPAPKPPLWLRWLRRFGPQDLLSACLSGLWCWRAADWVQDPAWLGLGAALVETLVFYGVAFCWHHAPLPQRTRALLREYGPSELLDLLLRPTFMMLGAALAPRPVIGVALASLAADCVFYALAWRRGWGPA